MSALRERHPDLKGWEAFDAKRGVPVEQLAPVETAGRPIATRERDTFNKLMIGLAVAAYGFDPAKGRSTVATEIHEYLRKLDLDVSVDTVRSKLRATASVLSGDVLRRISCKE